MSDGRTAARAAFAAAGVMGAVTLALIAVDQLLSLDSFRSSMLVGVPVFAALVYIQARVGDLLRPA